MSSATTTRAVATPVISERARGIIVAGLVVGAVLGFAGNFVGRGAVQDLMFGLSAVGLIVATVLLAVEHAWGGDRLAAAGFAVLALGETRILNTTDVPGGEVAFAAGVFLYAPALVMVALSSWAPLWVRLVGALAAIPFAAHALTFFGGGAVESTGPLAGAGYALLTVTVLAWAWTVLRTAQEGLPGEPR